MKVIVLLLGLAVGFGVGVYWGVHHPAQAQKLADEEERRFLEKQKQLLEKVKSKLDQLASSRTGTTGATGRTGFVAGGQSGGAKDPDVDSLRDESQRQLAEVDKMLSRK